MPNEDPKQSLDHIFFWLWEYTRRNHPDNGPRDLIIDGHAYTITYDPVERGHAYQTSDDIINALIDKTFRPLYPPYFKNAPVDEGLTRLIDLDSVLYPFTSRIDQSSILYPLETALRPSEKIFIIDLSRPLAELSAELEDIYTSYQTNGIARALGNNISRIRLQYAPLIKDGKILQSLEARAIGLWIYDQLQLGRTNQSALARELMAREGFATVKQGDIVKYASPYVRQTTKCINSKTILPIK